jgi:hypothetical protein
MGLSTVLLVQHRLKASTQEAFISSNGLVDLFRAGSQITSYTRTMQQTSTAIQHNATYHQKKVIHYGQKEIPLNTTVKSKLKMA